MIKEIKVAGIKLYNYNVFENLARIAKNLEANVFTTIEEIDMKTILLAKEDESVKEVLESLDVTVFSEAGVLDAIGEATILRRAEIERREFFLQFMKIVEHSGYTVYIIGKDQKEIAAVSQYLADEFSRMKVSGLVALDEIDGEDYGIINDINTLAPDIILSVLPSPIQEKFLKEYKPMLLAKIWYGVGKGKIAGTRLTIGAKIMKKFRKLELLRYVQEGKENEET